MDEEVVEALVERISIERPFGSDGEQALDAGAIER